MTIEALVTERYDANLVSQLRKHAADNDDTATLSLCLEAARRLEYLSGCKVCITCECGFVSVFIERPAQAICAKCGELLETRG